MGPPLHQCLKDQNQRNRYKNASEDHQMVIPKRRNLTNKQNSDDKPKKNGMTPQEQCLQAARWIPQGVDMFCKLADIFQIAPLIEQREAAEKVDHIEDEKMKNDCEAILKNVSKDVEDQTMQSYKRITTTTPYLLTLVNGNRKKRQELEGLLAEMQVIIGQVRSEDASHLKPVIRKYAAPNPDDKDLEPPISANNHKSCVQRWALITHSSLGWLCPVKYLSEYSKDPQGTHQKLQAGDIKIHALVMKHLFTGPSTALSADGESVGTRPCNACLHNMTTVEAENIAYSVIQSRFAIGSLDKWREDDGTYNYQDAYYRIISTIRDAPDPSWAKALHEHWNLKLFKNKLGLHAASSSTHATNTNDDDDNFALMWKQYEQRLADEATARMVAPIPADSGPEEELPTPLKSPSVPPTSDDIDSSASTSNHHPPPKILPPSLDPKPREPVPSKKSKLSVVSEEPADELNDLSEADKEPQPPKSKSKKGRARKAVLELPLPPKKARTTRKRK
ncbi:hypothetical protein EDB19DRAFT_1960348 [Suillus lakei]|nr:hypothetical protein EDB19DRAFT_1960348 [Suillus lakei]